MNFFKIILLIGTLVGVFGIDSCFFGVEKAGITKQQIEEFINNVSNEGGNPLESVAKLGKLSSIAEKLKTIHWTNNEQILNEIDGEIDELAITSPTVEKQKEELKAAVRKYASVKIGTPAYVAAKVKLLDASEGWVTSVLNNLKFLNEAVEQRIEIPVVERIRLRIEVKRIVKDEAKSTSSNTKYKVEGAPLEFSTTIQDSLAAYIKSIALYRAAEVEFESAIKAVEEAAAADAPSSELEKKEIEEERAMLEKIYKYKNTLATRKTAFAEKWKSLEQNKESRKKIFDENRSNYLAGLSAISEECKELEEYKKIFPIILNQGDKSTEYIAGQAVEMTMILLNKKRKLKLTDSYLVNSYLYDTNGRLNIPKNPAYQVRESAHLFHGGLTAQNLKKLKEQSVQNTLKRLQINKKLKEKSSTAWKTTEEQAEEKDAPAIIPGLVAKKRPLREQMEK